MSDDREILEQLDFKTKIFRMQADSSDAEDVKRHILESLTWLKMPWRENEVDPSWAEEKVVLMLAAEVELKPLILGLLGMIEGQMEALGDDVAQFGQRLMKRELER